MDRLLIDLAVDEVSVSTYVDSQQPQAVGAPAALSPPLDAEALRELRWYLEEYLLAPFAVYEDRGRRIADRLPEWGHALFNAVFGGGSAREAYDAVRRHAETSGAAELVLRSDSPQLLGLPWELMREPSADEPVALSGIGISRSLATSTQTQTFTVGGAQLRVLMVIARPAGTRDVAYRMIARPLLERLDAVRGKVDLRVLRPATIDALAATLREAHEAGEPFQIVHIDGHGVLTGARPGFDSPDTDQGLLAFERSGGGQDLVPAERLAAVLAAARVPVVVLNACQAGAVGRQLETAVATRLPAGGASAVVAMAYTVYAVAAAEFMAAFYERLFTGATVAESVRIGRERMARRPARPSPRGDLPLSDWLIPVHYMRQAVRFPELEALSRTHLLADSLVLTTSAPDVILDQHRSLERGQYDVDDPTSPADGVFVGRDDLLYTVEMALRTRKVVVLHGSAGSGKTEAAKAFGRWWRDTGGTDDPDALIWHSFQPGIASFGLEGVILTVGNALGLDLAGVEPAEQRAQVRDTLQERRALMVWDNFESVCSMPDPTSATPPLDARAHAEFRDFLSSDLGQSAVLITSRTDEAWLGEDDVTRVEVEGLRRQEAAEYADMLLHRTPAAAPKREERAFEELLKWLNGHPLSMRLTLPMLETDDPATILAELQGTQPPSADSSPASLAASITYSMRHLAPETRQRLAVAALFHEIIDVDVLARLSRLRQVPRRFRRLTAADWTAVLAEAARVGLLTASGDGVQGAYRIPPGLPGYLAMQWRAEDGQRYERRRERAMSGLLEAYAGSADWMDDNQSGPQADFVRRIIRARLPMMGHLLGYALDQRRWDLAQRIYQPLGDFWAREGMFVEARDWTDRAVRAVEDGNGEPSALGGKAGTFWLYLMSSQVEQLGQAGYFDAAEQVVLKLQGVLQRRTQGRGTKGYRLLLAETYHLRGTLEDSRGRLDLAEQWLRQALHITKEVGDRRAIAGTCHQLGMIEHRRGQLDQAEEWYRQSIAINMEIKDQPGLAVTYHQLGLADQFRGRLDEARHWYEMALDIDSALGNEPGVAAAYDSFGMLERLRGRLDEAEEWYRESLIVSDRIGDMPAMAVTRFQLGVADQQRDQYDEAERWYQESLAIFQELNNQPEIAKVYHQLGSLAFDKGLLEDAEGWFLQALGIHGRLHNEADTARSLHHLGAVEQERGRLDEAERWYRRALEINERLDNRPELVMHYGQLGLLAEQRGDTDDAMKWVCRSVAVFDDFPHPMTAQSASHLAMLSRQYGVEAVERNWTEVTGAPLPPPVRLFIDQWQEPEEDE
ncbi:tetratricopeptide repeat protein [Phytohabitans flavus]|uniref:tetratricopeptide repeat protein n=1 Tax=Phytohabitans flavus TaxID=1076124 RepID=UPI00363C347E